MCIAPRGNKQEHQIGSPSPISFHFAAHPHCNTGSLNSIPMADYFKRRFDWKKPREVSGDQPTRTQHTPRPILKLLKYTSASEHLWRFRMQCRHIAVLTRVIQLCTYLLSSHTDVNMYMCQDTYSLHTKNSLHVNGSFNQFFLRHFDPV